ncbi:hypothetical protein I550_3055 [Mycobacterium intracellulare 1956]|uniref:Uncharacterized protein n=1 Tax=Mycobacterium intracellulare 1956 TaxID=1299331 RepID=X8CI05_MYCIT|nr:hypothetical protein I550_3055 [Mycobacterium intracellulare 1956]
MPSIREKLAEALRVAGASLHAFFGPVGGRRGAADRPKC